MARERLERTVRVEADIRTQGDQRLEVRGVGTEIYRDAKRSAATFVDAFVNALTWLLLGLGVIFVVSCLAMVFAPPRYAGITALGGFVVVAVAAYLIRASKRISRR